MMRTFQIIIFFLSPLLVYNFGTKFTVTTTTTKKEFILKKIESETKIYFGHTSLNVALDYSGTTIETFNKSLSGFTFNGTSPCIGKGGYLAFKGLDTNLIIFLMSSGAEAASWSSSSSPISRIKNSDLNTFRYFEDSNNKGYFIMVFNEPTVSERTELIGIIPLFNLSSFGYLSYDFNDGSYWKTDVVAYMSNSNIVIVPIQYRTSYVDWAYAHKSRYYYYKFSTTCDSYCKNPEYQHTKSLFITLGHNSKEIACNSSPVSSGFAIHCGQMYLYDKILLFCHYIGETTAATLINEELSTTQTLRDFDLGKFKGYNFYLVFRVFKPESPSCQLDFYFIYYTETTDKNYVGKFTIQQSDESFKTFHAVITGTFSTFIVGSKLIGSNYEYYYDRYFFRFYKLGTKFTYDRGYPEEMSEKFVRYIYKGKTSTLASQRHLERCNYTNQDCLDDCESGYYRKKNYQEGDYNCYRPIDLPGWIVENGKFRQCSTPYYYQIQNGTTYCISDCKSNNPSLFYDYYNTKLCLTTCGSDKVWFTHSNGKKFCLNTCEENNTNFYYAEYPSNECVTSCPAKFYNTGTKKFCLSICEKPGNVYNMIKEQTNECLSQCQKKKYVDNNITHCVDSCETLTNTTYNKNDFTDQTVCLTECSAHFFEEGTKITCISACQAHTIYKYDSNNLSKKCLSSCPEKFYKEGQDYICIPTCENTTNFKGNVLNGTECLESCPVRFYIDNSTNQLFCLTACSASPIYKLESSESNTECVSVCGKKYSVNSNNVTTCLHECGGTYSITRDGTNECLSECSKYIYQSICAESCEALSKAYQHNSKTCLDNCTANYYLPEGNANKKTCVDTCETTNGAYKYNSVEETNKQCYSNYSGHYFKDGSKYYTVSECPTNTKFKYDSGSGECLTECPDKFYTDGTKFFCVSNCNGTYSKPEYGTKQCFSDCPKMHYMDGSQEICINNCEMSQDYKYNKFESIIKECLSSCDKRTYTDENNTKYCIENCHESTTHKKYHYTEMLCLSQCPKKYYIDGQKEICVDTCDSEHNIEGYKSKQCFSSCTEKYMLDKYGTKFCMSECNDQIYNKEKESDNSQCVPNCSTNFIITGENTFVCSNCDGQNGYLKHTKYNHYTDECLSQCDFKSYSDASNSNKETCINECSGTYDRNDFNTPKQCNSDCNTRKFYNESGSIYCIDQCEQSTIYSTPVPNSQECKISCPNETPKYYLNGTNIACLTSCDGQPIYNKTTNTRECLSVCPSKYYVDGNSIICVSQCEGQAVYNKNILNSQQCVSNCTAKFYKEGNSVTCVDSCKESTNHKITKLNDNECLSVCNNKFYLDEDNLKTCLNRCEDSDNYKNNSYGTDECLPKCLSSFFIQENKTYCVDNCSVDPVFNKELIGQSKECFSQCPQKKYTDAISGRQYCLSKCSVSSIYRHDKFGTNECVSNCDDYYYFDADDNNKKVCVDNCRQNPTYSKFKFNSKECLSACKAKFYTDTDNTTVCVSKCSDNPNYKYTEDGSSECLTGCPNKYFLNANEEKICTPNCSVSSGYPYPKYDSKECFSECSLKYYMDGTQKTCVDRCGDNRQFQVIKVGGNENECLSQCTTKKSSINGTVYCAETCSAFDTFKKTKYEDEWCLSVCNYNFYKDGNEEVCIDRCGQNPSYDKPLEGSQECFSECKDHYYTPTKTSQICLTDCKTHQIYKNIKYNSKQCLSQCILKYYLEDQDTYCVNNCGEEATYSKIDYNEQEKCLSECEKRFYIENNITYCLSTCADSPTYKNIDSSSKECLSNCPAKFYIFNGNNYCTEKCESTTSYKCNDFYSNECFSVCPYKSYIKNKSKFCVSKCSDSPEYYISVNNSKECISQCTRGMPEEDDVDHQIYCTYKQLERFCENKTETLISTTCNNDIEYEEFLNSTYIDSIINYAVMIEKDILYVKPTNNSNFSFKFYKYATEKLENNESKVNIESCIPLLKEKYHDQYDLSHNDEIFVALTEVANQKLISGYSVQYEIYTIDLNYNVVKLNKSLCLEKQEAIPTVEVFPDLNNPLSNYDTFEDLFLDKGVNIYNINDSFYVDNCKGYIDKRNNKDMTTYDRMKVFYRGDITLCDNGCSFVGIDSTTNQIQCDCYNSTNLDIGKLIDTEIEQLDTNLLSSNFYIFKCKSKGMNIVFIVCIILVVGQIVSSALSFFFGVNQIIAILFPEPKPQTPVKKGENEVKSEMSKDEKSSIKIEVITEAKKDDSMEIKKLDTITKLEEEAKAAKYGLSKFAKKSKKTVRKISKKDRKDDPECENIRKYQSETRRKDKAATSVSFIDKSNNNLELLKSFDKNYLKESEELYFTFKEFIRIYFFSTLESELIYFVFNNKLLTKKLLPVFQRVSVFCFIAIEFIFFDAYLIGPSQISKRYTSSKKYGIAYILGNELGLIFLAVLLSLLINYIIMFLVHFVFNKLLKVILGKDIKEMMTTKDLDCKKIVRLKIIVALALYLIVSSVFTVFCEFYYNIFEAASKVVYARCIIGIVFEFICKAIFCLIAYGCIILGSKIKNQ